MKLLSKNIVFFLSSLHDLTVPIINPKKTKGAVIIKYGAILKVEEISSILENL